MSLLIRQVLVQDRIQDVLITEGKITRIGNRISEEAARELSGKNRALLPSFHNGHTHSPMTLLRGYGDDMPLFPWLQEKIWPAEAKYREEDFYWGYRLAFLEMTRSGTGFFNDMYFQHEIGLNALEESGLKGAVNYVFLHGDSPEEEIIIRKSCESWFDSLGDRPAARFAGLAPHSIYMVSEKTLRWIGDFARERDLKIHIHLSETEQENKDCLSAHGKTPTAWLDSLGLTCRRLSIAHGLWLNDDDRRILAEHSIPVVYNPASNMKLASGPALDVQSLMDRNIPVILGTDGCSSNNNLNMFDEMKLAALLQKQHFGDPTRFSAEEVFRSATETGAVFWGTGGGRIAEGAAADLQLIRLDIPEMVPCHSLISNLVYSAPRSAVDTLIADGRILMEEGKIEGEEQILREAGIRANNLIKRQQDDR